MNIGYTEQIRDRIINAPEGSVFVNSDFADIADNNTIKQSINRLIQEGILRVLSGKAIPVYRCLYLAGDSIGDRGADGLNTGPRIITGAVRNGMRPADRSEGQCML